MSDVSIIDLECVEKFDEYVYKICGNQMVFSYSFDKPITSYKIVGPSGNLTKFYGKKHSQTLRVPLNITHMVFGNINTKAIIVPPNIKRLTFGDYTTYKFEFNNGLEELIFGDNYVLPVVLSRSIRKLTVGLYFNNVLQLNRVICDLDLGFTFNRSFIINPCMKKISFGGEYNKPLTINANMCVLLFGFFFDKPLKLNKKLKMLQLDGNFFQDICLSKRLLKISLRSVKNCICPDLPKHLRHLILETDIYGTGLFNKRLGSLTISDAYGKLFFMNIKKANYANNDGFGINIYEFEHNNKTDYSRYVFKGSDSQYNSLIVFMVENMSNNVGSITLCKKQRVILNNVPNSLKKSDIKIISQPELNNYMNVDFFA